MKYHAQHALTEMEAHMLTNTQADTYCVINKQQRAAWKSVLFGCILAW